MFRPQINTKNFCCLYFWYSGKRSLDLKELDKFHPFLYEGLSKELSQNVNIIYTTYYLSQMICDYDNLFELKGEKLSLKKEVQANELKSQLSYMPTGLLIASCKVSKKYFNHSSSLNLSN